MTNSHYTETIRPPTPPSSSESRGFLRRALHAFWFTPDLAAIAAVRALILWHKRSRDRARLAAMEPYLLRDIGLTREQADSEAAKPFWRA